MESSCILLTDNIKAEYNEEKLTDYQIKMIFTGDTLFLGDVGRPDLTTSKSKKLTKFHLAEKMYESIQRLEKLPNDVIVYPGHGAGSACGKNISNATSCTIGKQKENNYAFKIKDKKEFIKTLTENIPAPPDYFFHNAEMNKTEKKLSLYEILKKAENSFSVEQFNKMAKDPNVIILDCRSLQEYKDAHVPKSLFSPLKAKFAIWAANLISNPKDPLVILCNPKTEKECITRLARTGIDGIIGYFVKFDEYLEKGYAQESVRDIEPEEVFAKYKSNSDDHQIIDVRNLGEYNSGHIDKANLISLNVINKNLEKVDDKKDVFLHCKSGTRSVVAYSFLDYSGYKNIKNINKGYQGLVQHKFDIIEK